MRLSAPELLRLGVVDEVVPEPAGGAHLNPDEAIATLGAALRRHLDALLQADAAREVRECARA